MPEAVQARAFFLVGPTASGKTALAHRLAEKLQARVLSVDAMLVYRGLDIGTAKPPAAERARFGYGGVDLADPDAAFSAGEYVRAVRAWWTTVPAGAPVIAVGGTGLYVRCLAEGLESGVPADPAWREEAETILAREGAAGLRARLRAADPARLARLADPENPRRLIRAVELARAGTAAGGWSEASRPHVVGLAPDPAWLARRIGERVDAMYRGGLLDEAAGLRRRYRALSETARHAIGYAEAFEVLDGRLGEAEARARTAQRTRQLARRQGTWFRRQTRTAWVPVGADDNPDRLADRIRVGWEEYGTVNLHG